MYAYIHAFNSRGFPQNREEEPSFFFIQQIKDIKPDTVGTK